MAKRDIIAVASKVLGLYVLVQGIGAVAGIFAGIGVSSLNGSMNFASYVLTFVLPVPVYFVLAWWLIMRSDRIAARLTAEEEVEEIKQAPDRETVLQIALIAVGVYFIAEALPHLPDCLVLLVAVARQPDYVSDYGGAKARAWTGLFQVLIQFALGAYLVLGSTPLVRIINTLRRA